MYVSEDTRGNVQIGSYVDRINKNYIGNRSIDRILLTISENARSRSRKWQLFSPYLVFFFFFLFLFLFAILLNSLYEGRNCPDHNNIPSNSMLLLSFSYIYGISNKIFVESAFTPKSKLLTLISSFLLSFLFITVG